MDLLRVLQVAFIDLTHSYALCFSGDEPNTDRKETKEKRITIHLHRIFGHLRLQEYREVG